MAPCKWEELNATDIAHTGWAKAKIAEQSSCLWSICSACNHPPSWWSQITGLLPTVQREPEIFLPVVQQQEQPVFRSDHLPHISHASAISDSQNHGFMHNEQYTNSDQPSGWPTEFQIDGLLTFATDFMDPESYSDYPDANFQNESVDMPSSSTLPSSQHSTYSHVNFQNELGDMASSSALPSSQDTDSGKRKKPTSGTVTSGKPAKRPKRPCFKCGQDMCKGSSRKTLLSQCLCRLQENGLCR